jgi:3-oxoacyl-[acyl-carrier protein] reductase
MSYQGQCYVIIGASGGIGSVLTRQLIKQGAKVLLAGRNEAAITELAEELKMPQHVVDATDITAVMELMEKAKAEFGDIAGAVNCVGSILLKPAHLITEKEWLDTININLTSAFALVRAAGKTMLQQKFGSVVLLSTAATLLGLPNHEAIAGAKAGINGLAISAAATYAANHLRFNCVAPGLVETKLSERIVASDKGREISLANHPVGRLGKPEDVANMIAFLLDPENDWITGQIIAVDGGLSSIKKMTG